MLLAMRRARLIENDRCCHLISGLAHRALFLDDEEKSRAVGLLRRVEESRGVIVLAYAIMTNHFHIFIYVPEPEELDDDEVLGRINVLYRDASLSQVLGEWTRLKNEEDKLLACSGPAEGRVPRFGEFRQSFLGRMWNPPESMRTYKQHFTMSFNGRRDHRGTMFEGRRHGRSHRREEAVMWRTSAYIDMNACEAGIVNRPEDYEWCSFAAAVKGGEKARRGYAFMYGSAADWETLRGCHEKSMHEAVREILAAREAEKEPERNGRVGARRAERTVGQSRADPRLEMPEAHSAQLVRGKPETVERILALLRDGPMRPSAIRKAIGIGSSVHFNRYYPSPMLEQGLIARTAPGHPKSPQQKYRLS